MANVGKEFEKDFIGSVPSDIFHYRFRDLPFFLTKNAKYEVNNNPADFLIMGDILYVLELKSCAGSSYPTSNTRKNQVEGMLKYSTMRNVMCGFVINMRKYNKTFFLHIKDYIFITKDKKSINLHDLETYGLLIEQELKRTRYKYNIQNILDIKG